jgi:hypothetical protein
MPKRNRRHAACRTSGSYVDILDDAIRRRINDVIDTGKIFGGAPPRGRAQAFPQRAD